MEKFEISVEINHRNEHFEVYDFMHHEIGQPKYEVYKDGQFIGSLEPDTHKILQVCKDPGIVTADILHLIANQLEKYHI